MTGAIGVLPVPACRLGESPLWHPAEAVLYWVDIAGRALHRWDPRGGVHAQWAFDTEPGCIAPVASGGLLVALRDGLWRFDPSSGARTRLAAAPYDPAVERFNDGKAGPDGCFWAGTMHERREPKAALYRWDGASLDRIAGGVTTSNGLAWSPDGATMYWADTRAHEIAAYDFDVACGVPSKRRVFARFAPRADGEPIERYGGRPDGAAVDADGFYWAAMYEGARLVRLAPDGRVERELALPVRCPTMPCFGGDDLRTLYVTSAREQRPADELAAMPWSGRVLTLRVDVAGRPAHAVRG